MLLQKKSMCTVVKHNKIIFTYTQVNLEKSLPIFASKMGATLKRKNLLQVGANSLL